MCNLCITEILAEKTEKKGEKIFELPTAQKFPRTENKPEIQETQKTPSKKH